MQSRDWFLRFLFLNIDEFLMEGLFSQITGFFPIFLSLRKTGAETLNEEGKSRGE